MRDEALDATTRRLVQRLLDARLPAGHWEGRLSPSALSTATAVMALWLADRETQAGLIARGIEWLAAHQNRDGGWGDTVLSLSNISTTSLAWAALGMAAPGRFSTTEASAEAWLRQSAGSLEPQALALAISRRYGEDRTFSTPILTVLALAGKLGRKRDAWRDVMQLPFELASFPQRWFHRLRLPVVSYALPALIAVGQVRHAFAPTRNPLLRAFRNMARERTLGLLARIQPASGGYLEAIPLTSFVVMSLAAAGRPRHPVAARGVDFLRRTNLPDGSWAIDTNLATWVTTLSVDALASLPGSPSPLDSGDGERILRWLLAQQYRDTHPYTLAPPGAWAWTDLPGGVPDADDTSGAILALHALAPQSAEVRQSALHGIAWLADLQNADGGIPTFCPGWGKLPFDRSSPDITAHALRAWKAWLPGLPKPLDARIQRAMRRAFAFLENVQRPDGSWVPLWFGNQFSASHENPVYGTARVLLALADAPDPAAARMAQRGLQWLLAAQRPDGGWGHSIEETAVALHACTVHRADAAALGRAAQWLVRATAQGAHAPPAPIGFYFASLWYFEELYPLIFAVAALRRAAPAQQDPLPPVVAR